MRGARPWVLLATAAVLVAPSCPMPSESLDPLPVRTNEPSPPGSTLVYVADSVTSRNGSLTVVAMPSGKVVNRIDGRSQPPPRILPGTRYAFHADLFGAALAMKLYRTDLLTGARTLVIDVGTVQADVAVLGTVDGERAYVLNVVGGEGDRQIRLTGYDGSSGRLIAEHVWPLRAGEIAVPDLAILDDGRVLAAVRITAANNLTAIAWTVFDRDLGRGIPVAPGVSALAAFIRGDGCDPRLRPLGDGRLVTVCGRSQDAVAAVAIFDAASLQLSARIPIGAAAVAAGRAELPLGAGMRSVIGWNVGGDGRIAVLLSNLVTAVVDPRSSRVVESVALDPAGGFDPTPSFGPAAVSGRLALIFNRAGPNGWSGQQLVLVDLLRPNDRTMLYTAPVIRAVREAGDRIYLLVADSPATSERIVELDRASGRVTAQSAPLPRRGSAIVASIGGP